MKKIFKKAGVLSIAIIFGLGFLQTFASTDVILVKGNDRTKTSIESSRYVNSKDVVIASGFSFADSLSAFNIASSKNAKLILATGEKSIISALNEINPGKIFVVGGRSQVSDSTFGSYLYKVERISGRNRYETNEKTLNVAGYNKVGVADGRKFPDALSASGLLREEGLGLMLVDGSKNYTTNREVVYTIGGLSSVVKDGGTRISGKNRYDTSKLIKSRMAHVRNASIATGKNFPDALSAVNLVVGKNNTAVLLLDSITNTDTSDLKKLDNIFIIGGSVNDIVISTLRNKNISNIQDNKDTVTNTDDDTTNEANKESYYFRIKRVFDKGYYNDKIYKTDELSELGIYGALANNGFKRGYVFNMPDYYKNNFKKGTPDNVTNVITVVPREELELMTNDPVEYHEAVIDFIMDTEAKKAIIYDFSLVYDRSIPTDFLDDVAKNMGYKLTQNDIYKKELITHYFIVEKEPISNEVKSDYVSLKAALEKARDIAEAKFWICPDLNKFVERGQEKDRRHDRYIVLEKF